MVLWPIFFFGGKTGFDRFWTEKWSWLILNKKTGFSLVWSILSRKKGLLDFDRKTGYGRIWLEKPRFG